MAGEGEVREGAGPPGVGSCACMGGRGRSSCPEGQFSGEEPGLGEAGKSQDLAEEANRAGRSGLESSLEFSIPGSATTQQMWASGFTGGLGSRNTGGGCGM